MGAEQQRFHYHLQKDPSFAFYVREDVDTPWIRIESFIEGRFVGSEAALPASAAGAGLVAYPSGEVLCAFGEIGRPPVGVHFMNGPEYRDNTPGFDARLVRNGLGGVAITHGPSASQPGDARRFYSTGVRNSGSSRIRVYKFGPFDRGLLGISKEPKAAYYSPRQFREWYRVPDPEGWIAPGEEVCDPDNYGCGRGVWAYFFESIDGDKFIGTAPLERRVPR